MEKIVRLKEVVELTGLSRATILRKVKDKKFPRKRRLGPKAVGWFYSEVLEWINACPVIE